MINVFFIIVPSLQAVAAKVYSLFVVVDVVFHPLSTAGAGDFGPDRVSIAEMEDVGYDLLQIRFLVALELFVRQRRNQRDLVPAGIVDVDDRVIPGGVIAGDALIDYARLPFRGLPSRS